MISQTPTRFDPAAYEAKVNEYLKQMGVDPQTASQVAAQETAAAGAQGGLGATTGTAATTALSLYTKRKLAEMIQQKFGEKAAEQVATTAAGNAVAPTYSAASQAAWNAGADASTAATATGAETGAATGTTATGVAPYLGAAAALYGAYNLYDNWGTGGSEGRKKGAMDGATTGAGIGTMILPGVGTAIGGGLGALAGLGLGSIKVGKHKDQIMRDKIRAYLEEKKITDKYNLMLKDGSKYDIGIDGGTRPYNVDFGRDKIGDVVGLANPLAAALTGGDEKLTSDFAGYFTNAAMSGGNAKDNIKGFVDKAGLTQRGIYDLLEQQIKDKARLAAYQNGVNQIFGNNGFSAPSATTTRSSTLSPGIGKDGKRVSSGRSK